MNNKLRILIDNQNYSKDTIVDVEKEFFINNYDIDSTDEKLMHDIDKCKYNREDSTITDRFGSKLYLQRLSTGCKAGIVANHSESPVLLVECEVNAIKSIIALCSGTIIIADDALDFVNNIGYSNIEKEIEYETLKFSSIDEMNKFLSGEYI